MKAVPVPSPFRAMQRLLVGLNMYFLPKIIYMMNGRLMSFLLLCLRIGTKEETGKGVVVKQAPEEWRWQGWESGGQPAL